jgi:hypothetical protein
VKTTRLRITLREVTPSVIRVIDVPAACTLPELHDLLQVALGWTASHLHEFVAGEKRYGTPDEDFDDDVLPEIGVDLRDLPPRFVYRYDFGDDWEHDVEVVGHGGEQPGCVYGEGACPPEDCGGPGGYEDLLVALTEPHDPEREDLRAWASGWRADWAAEDQQISDQLVRDTVGQVPGSVRLLLGLLAGGVKLTPGGRLPRTVVRAVQDHRPAWCPWEKPASIEEDLLPLATLHDVLRQVGLARLSRGVLRPTKAAEDDLQIVRRLRRAIEPDSFADILVTVAVAELTARGPRTTAELAAAAHPRLGPSWAVDGHPVNPDDVQGALLRLSPLMQALDLIDADHPLWRAGPSARTLLPRVTALAHLARSDP